jgi:hypothetical protein
VTKLRATVDRLDEAKKKIVATKEGGAITGEERIREHADQLYGALTVWEGRPAQYQLERIDVLRRELDEVTKDLDTIVTRHIRPLDGELLAHKLAPIPTTSAPGEGGGDTGRGVVTAGLSRCALSRGADCEELERAQATARSARREGRD